ncbi:hypothetical protein OS493_018882 [Desmophyllum pertusum]|uniref:Secreted protein n=1 Tax=Desmophyllum pertusum TaxID=174260 RepID=A0A9W9ZCU1_9CNID|nr:hypothetical protein OS493_018882 [Desmophyllum pertusum]
MGKHCSTAFSLLFISVILATAIADRCQVVLLNRCKAVYQEALDASSKGEGGHCFRLQKMVTCLASEPKCGGQLIEKFRYWMLQMAMMDNILGICKDIDFSKLKEGVQESDVAKTHRFLDDVEYDTFDACAVTVHRECVRYYVTLLMKDRQFCGDAEKLNKCYDLYSSNIKCQAKIIKDFAHMVQDVAQSVLRLLSGYLKSLCTSSKEL